MQRIRSVTAHRGLAVHSFYRAEIRSLFELHSALEDVDASSVTSCFAFDSGVRFAPELWREIEQATPSVVQKILTLALPMTGSSQRIKNVVAACLERHLALPESPAGQLPALHPHLTHATFSCAASESPRVAALLNLIFQPALFSGHPFVDSRVDIMSTMDILMTVGLSCENRAYVRKKNCLERSLRMYLDTYNGGSVSKWSQLRWRHQLRQDLKLQHRAFVMDQINEIAELPLHLFDIAGPLGPDRNIQCINALTNFHFLTEANLLRHTVVHHLHRQLIALKHSCSTAEKSGHFADLQQTYKNAFQRLGSSFAPYVLRAIRQAALHESLLHSTGPPQEVLSLTQTLFWTLIEELEKAEMFTAGLRLEAARTLESIGFFAASAPPDQLKSIGFETNWIAPTYARLLKRVWEQEMSLLSWIDALSIAQEIAHGRRLGPQQVSQEFHTRYRFLLPNARSSELETLCKHLLQAFDAFLQAARGTELRDAEGKDRNFFSHQLSLLTPLSLHCLAHTLLDIVEVAAASFKSLEKPLASDKERLLFYANAIPPKTFCLLQNLVGGALYLSNVQTHFVDRHSEFFSSTSVGANLVACVEKGLYRAEGKIYLEVDLMTYYGCISRLLKRNIPSASFHWLLRQAIPCSPYSDAFSTVDLVHKCTWEAYRYHTVQARKLFIVFGTRLLIPCLKKYNPAICVDLAEIACHDPQLLKDLELTAQHFPCAAAKQFFELFCAIATAYSATCSLPDGLLILKAFQTLKTSLWRTSLLNTFAARKDLLYPSTTPIQQLRVLYAFIDNGWFHAPLSEHLLEKILYPRFEHALNRHDTREMRNVLLQIMRFDSTTSTASKKFIHRVEPKAMSSGTLTTRLLFLRVALSLKAFEEKRLCQLLSRLLENFKDSLDTMDDEAHESLFRLNFLLSLQCHESWKALFERYPIPSKTITRWTEACLEQQHAFLQSRHYGVLQEHLTVLIYSISHLNGRVLMTGIQDGCFMHFYSDEAEPRIAVLCCEAHDASVVHYYPPVLPQSADQHHIDIEDLSDKHVIEKSFSERTSPKQRHPRKLRLSPDVQSHNQALKTLGWEVVLLPLNEYDRVMDDPGAAQTFLRRCFQPVLDRLEKRRE